MMSPEIFPLPCSGRLRGGATGHRGSTVLWLVALLSLSGCATAPTTADTQAGRIPSGPQAALPAAVPVGLVVCTAAAAADSPDDSVAVHEAIHESLSVKNDAAGNAAAEPQRPPCPVNRDSLQQLEAVAVSQNPSLRRLAQQYQAARAKVRYVDGLPDPTVGGNVFAAPVETAAGSQRANLTISQMLPWLPRLDAQAQQACFEALALQQVHAAERLKIISQIRSLWYRLYVIDRQIETFVASQKLLASLIQVANARVATGKATQGDVLVGTLEYGKLEEQLVTLRQQRVSAESEMDRLLGRSADVAVHVPPQLDVRLPAWTHSQLRQAALEYQPDIAAARLRTQATRWGVAVAQLKRRPDFSINASWFAIDNNRPASPVVDVGQDAWSVGASVSIPLWERKYDALEQEASWNHAAAHASVDEVVQRYDAILRDLWEQAKAADETARLYHTTILPQARDTLAADQQSYVNGSVDFDRVVGDFRNLLTLELGYHRAVGRLATALARVQQATGTDAGEPESVR